MHRVRQTNLLREMPQRKLTLSSASGRSKPQCTEEIWAPWACSYLAISDSSLTLPQVMPPWHYDNLTNFADAAASQVILLAFPGTRGIDENANAVDHHADTANSGSSLLQRFYCTPQVEDVQDDKSRNKDQTREARIDLVVHRGHEQTSKVKMHQAPRGRLPNGSLKGFPIEDLFTLPESPPP